MTGNELAAAAGILLSLLFSYVPQLQNWYGAKDGQTKRLIMLGLMVVVAAGALGVSCAGWWSFVVCSQAGVKTLVEAFVAAVIANQAAFTISPQVVKTATPAPVPPPVV